MRWVARASEVCPRVDPDTADLRSGMSQVAEQITAALLTSAEAERALASRTAKGPEHTSPA